LSYADKLSGITAVCSFISSFRERCHARF